MEKPEVFVNRTLNLRKIKYIGFDMDHTLVRYNSQNFETLAHQAMVQKLVANKAYPEDIKNFKFDYKKSIRGLVIDKTNGNILKLNRFAAIRTSYHGLTRIEFDEQKVIYRNTYIDLSDTRNYSAIDTSFSVSFAVLYGQLVDYKDKHPQCRIPSYEQIATDLEFCLDQAHQDGSLKNTVVKNLDQYIVVDPEMVAGLERYKKHDKKLFVLTNSDFFYMRTLLDYSITPYLKHHKSWVELFDYVITKAKKPRFFYDNLDFYRLDLKTGLMSNYEGSLTPGIYQGGCAVTFTKHLGVAGDDILYIGDHIYHDVLRIKKDCNWRTALVLEEMDDELRNLKQAAPIDQRISELMQKKEPLEDKLVDVISIAKEAGTEADEKLIHSLQEEISEIDKEISSLIKKRENLFNPTWGEIMRVGSEESYFARQVETYACIYMGKLSQFLNHSPRTYFRAKKRTLPHEV